MSKCKHCGIEFEIAHSNASRSYWCSKKCEMEYSLLNEQIKKTNKNKSETIQQQKQDIVSEYDKAQIKLEEKRLELEDRKRREEKEAQEAAKRKIKADRLREDGKPFTAFLVEMNPTYPLAAAVIYFFAIFIVADTLRGITKFSVLGLIVSVGLSFGVYFLYDYFKLKRDRLKISMIVSSVLPLVIFIGIGLISKSKFSSDSNRKKEIALEEMMANGSETLNNSANSVIENTSNSDSVNSDENNSFTEEELTNQEAIEVEKTLYKIQDPDGYSNLRSAPNGDILKKVYDTETFEVIGTEGKYKKVRLSDGTEGYIHESRIVSTK